jgi:hypothetical protein
MDPPPHLMDAAKPRYDHTRRHKLMRQARETAHAALETHNQRESDRRNQHLQAPFDLKPGDKALFHVANSLTGPGAKFKDRYVGPIEVVQRHGGTHYLVRGNNDTTYKVRTQELKPYVETKNDIPILPVDQLLQHLRNGHPNDGTPFDQTPHLQPRHAKTTG